MQLVNAYTPHLFRPVSTLMRMTWRERLKSRRKELGISQSRIAKACGITQPAVADWENGKTQEIRGDHLLRTAKLLQVSPEWLMSGSGDKTDPEFVTVPMGAPARVAEPAPSYADDVTVRFFPRVRASAGPGAENDHGEPLGLRFSAASLRKRGINPDRCMIIYADGDSMEPDITDGDVVMFDTSTTDIKDGRVYVVQVDGRELVKMLHRRPGGQVLVQSRNEAYPPYTVSTEQDGFRVLGRVIWTAGWM